MTVDLDSRHPQRKSLYMLPKGKCICMLKGKFCVASFWFLTIVILFVFVFFSFTPALKALVSAKLLKYIYFCMIFSFVFFFSRDQCRFPQVAFKKLNILPLVIYMVHDYSFFGQHWKHLYLQNFHFFFLRSESNLYFHHPAFGRSGYRLSNSTVIFLPDV
jgi:hypothetical protein